MEAQEPVRSRRSDPMRIAVQLPEVSGIEVTRWLKEDEVRNPGGSDSTMAAFRQPAFFANVPVSAIDPFSLSVLSAGSIGRTMPVARLEQV